MNATATFFTQTLVIVTLPYVAWRYGGARKLVPLVVMQILGGILVGPSVLGTLAPEIWSQLFNPQTLSVLKGPAWLAVVLFAFLTGLHLQPAELRAMGRTFSLVSLASFVIPGLMGIAAGFWIVDHYPTALGVAATPWQFALGIGLCSGVTALPVLGAILRETGLIHLRVGRFALGTAAVSDAALWMLLALLLMGLSHHPEGLTGFFRIPLLALLYLAVMVLLVRPLLGRLRAGDHDEWGLVLVCSAIFASALVTELIGLHATLGGFMVGVLIPRPLAHAIIDRLEPLTIVLLLPFFFTLTGMSTTFGWDAVGLLTITGVATLISLVGKIGGTALVARALGETGRDALLLGILMQTKGMMEVVLLTILLEAGIISNMAFSAILAMALLTTAMTTPLLCLVEHSCRLHPPPQP